MGFWGLETFFGFLPYFGPACELARQKKYESYSLAETDRSAHRGSPVRIFGWRKSILDFAFFQIWARDPDPNGVRATDFVVFSMQCRATASGGSEF